MKQTQRKNASLEPLTSMQEESGTPYFVVAIRKHWEEPTKAEEDEDGTPQQVGLE